MRITTMTDEEAIEVLHLWMRTGCVRSQVEAVELRTVMALPMNSIQKKPVRPAEEEAAPFDLHLEEASLVDTGTRMRTVTNKVVSVPVMMTETTEDVLVHVTMIAMRTVVVHDAVLQRWI